MDKVNGEVVCSDCGLVVAENMFNRHPEWSAFTFEERQSRSRIGTPVSYARFDKGLHTMIGCSKDASGNPLSAKAKRQAWRLRKWHMRLRIKDSRSQNLLKAMSKLQIISEKLHIAHSVQERAAIIYRKALDEDLIRGRTIVAVVAASLYVACRSTKNPTLLNDIAKAGMLSRGEVSKAYRLLIGTLEIKIPTQDPLDYISKFTERLYVSGEVQGIAVRLLHAAKRKRLTVGKDPLGIVATLVYIACQLKSVNVTQKEIAAVSGISVMTIRNRKRELTQKLCLRDFQKT
jgi:transcription initiation factor TFIIB